MKKSRFTELLPELSPYTCEHVGGGSDSCIERIGAPTTDIKSDVLERSKDAKLRRA